MRYRHQHTRPLLAILLLVLLATSVVAGTGGGPFVSGIMRGLDGNDVITGMARFSNGDVAVCGYLPYATGAWDDAPGFDHDFNGGDDAFIAVLNEDLTVVKAFTLFGGRENDRATALAIRDDELIIVTGTTASDDLPVSTGSIAPLYSKGLDGFLVAFNPELTDVQFGTYINGAGDEHPMNIALDGVGSIYLCGTTTSATGFPTNNGYDQQYEGGTDGFVMRISPNAASIQFSTYYGSEGYDEIRDLHLDNSGSIYLAGTTHSANFPTFPYVEGRWWWRFRDRPYDWTYNGGLSDAFLLILSEDGAQCIVATFYGGEGEDVATGVVVQDGEVKLVGTTTSPDLAVDGGQQGFLNGNTDAFLATFDATGRSMKGATYFGGSGDETVLGAVPGPTNNVLLWGVTTSRDLPVAGYMSRQTVYGAEDAFFAGIGVGTASLVSTVGGTAMDTVARCLVEPDGSILMAGHTLSRQVPLDTGLVNSLAPAGAGNAMVVRYAPGAIALSSPNGAELRCAGQTVTVSFSRVEMRNGDRYEVQASTDERTWTTVVGPTDRNSVTWTIDDPAYVGKDIYLRVVSSRRHVTSAADPVTVDPKPEIVEQPVEKFTACSGTDLELVVKAAGEGLNYQWRLDGQPLPGETAPTLQRTNATTIDAGRYDVVVEARCGSEITSEVSTVVIVENTEIVEQPADQTVTEGQTIVLTCQAIGTDVSYQWYHNDAILTGRTTPTLTIAGADADDAGQYRCEVESDCGDVTSESATVIVEPTVSVEEQSNASSQISLSGEHPVRTTLTMVAQDQALLSGAYQIVSIAGEVVDTGIAEGRSTQLVHAIDLPAGLYVVVLRDARLPFIVVER